MTQHTPLPWLVLNGSIYAKAPCDSNHITVPIAYMDRDSGNGTSPVERDENAALIVRAVNNHEGLLAACRELMAIVERCEPVVLGDSHESHQHRAGRAFARTTIAAATPTGSDKQ